MSRTIEYNSSDTGELAYRTVRAAISDKKLIEWINEETYQSELTEQELVIEGLCLLMNVKS